MNVFNQTVLTQRQGRMHLLQRENQKGRNGRSHQQMQSPKMSLVQQIGSQVMRMLSQIYETIKL